MPAPNKAATRILVVDDNSLVRAALCRIMREGGYEIAGEMSSGNDFRQVVQQAMPDIICLDQQMPGRDGMSLLREVQAMEAGIAVVMITSSIDPEIEAEALASGVSSFIRKPFSAATIICELNQVDHARKLLTKNSEMEGTKIVGLRVIIADDSELFRKLLVSILVDIGVEVMGEARNGQEAIDLVEQYPVEAVLLDINMPVMGGIEALTTIRKMHPSIRVIMVSGNAQSDMVRQAIALGAYGYLLKPYNREKIIAVMSRLLF